MPEDDPCPAGDHRAPRTGGSCACGLVTLVPATVAGFRPGVRELLGRCLDDGPSAAVPEHTAIARVAQERVDRLLEALAEAGLTLTPRPEARQPA